MVVLSVIFPFGLPLTSTNSYPYMSSFFVLYGVPTLLFSFIVGNNVISLSFSYVTYLTTRSP